MRSIMAEEHYVLSNTADAAERERLGLLEQTEDARSQRHLTALGIQRGWKCLEIGAGRGSMVRWLAEQVGPQGRVVATDINTRFLTELQLPNVEVRQHDIRTDPLESGAYDLAHCRAVLVHMPDPQLVVRRMVDALRSGGWLLVEEGDASSLRAVDPNHPLAERFHRQSQELRDRLIRLTGYNPDFGCRVRALLEDVGLTEIGNAGENRIARGGEAEASNMSMALPAFVERGVLSPAECAAHQQILLDPSFSFVTWTTFAAWGKRANTSPGRGGAS
jgi:SAM-dependent methyltransferase